MHQWKRTSGDVSFWTTAGMGERGRWRAYMRTPSPLPPSPDLDLRVTTTPLPLLTRASNKSGVCTWQLMRCLVQWECSKMPECSSSCTLQQIVMEDTPLFEWGLTGGCLKMGAPRCRLHRRCDGDSVGCTGEGENLTVEAGTF